MRIDPTERLEHLIARYLDEECTPAERKELFAHVRSEPQAEALFEESAALDRECKQALRRALGRSLDIRPARSRAALAVRLLPAALAACLATMFYFSPTQRTGNDGSAQMASSWFATPPWLDAVEPAGPDAAAVRERNVGRSWVVVPGQPGEYMVIEIKKVQRQRKRSPFDF